MEADRDNQINIFFCVRWALTPVVMEIDGINPVLFLCFRICRKIRKRDWKLGMVFFMFVCVHRIPYLSGIHPYSSHNKTCNMLNRHTSH